MFGLDSISGSSEEWMVEMHGSFAGVEDLDRAMGPVTPRRAGAGPDELLPLTRTMIAVYRPNLSYRPGDAIRAIPKSRYWYVSLHRVQIGREAEFAEAVRARTALSDWANLDRPQIAYQVVSGAPAGTFVFFAPLASLRILDDGIAKWTGFVEAGAAAKKAGDVEIFRENLLFRVEPRMSYVSDDFAAGDPEFWGTRAKQK
jgi:hypothetical protein